MPVTFPSTARSSGSLPPLRIAAATLLLLHHEHGLPCLKAGAPWEFFKTVVDWLTQSLLAVVQAAAKQPHGEA